MSDLNNPPSTGYENALRSALPTFDGSASLWNRWKRRFLVYMTEMSLKEDLLDENKKSTEKQAKIARLLLIALHGTAADIVYSQTDDDTPGHDIWTLLCSTYEAETTSSIAALTEQFFALEPPSSSAEVQPYINKTLELRSQIKAISSNDAPSDAMVYGKIKRGLHNIKGAGSLLRHARPRLQKPARKDHLHPAEGPINGLTIGSATGIRRPRDLQRSAAQTEGEQTSTPKPAARPAAQADQPAATSESKPAPPPATREPPQPRQQQIQRST